MNTLQLQKVALRQRAVFIDNVDPKSEFSPNAADFCAEMYKVGYVPDEKLLRALNAISKEKLADIYSVVKEVLGLDKNWTPLVKDWLEPTGEDLIDHLITAFVNYLDDSGKTMDGFRMPCGHLIPKGTFPIERYNGCPFCGTPFEFANDVHTNQASKRKILTLWTLDDLRNHFRALLSSPVALDATQRDSLGILLENFPLPDKLRIPVKENVVMVVDALIGQGKPELASQFFTSPDDILRYLWFKKTNQIQVVKPAVLIRNANTSVGNLWRMSQEKKDAAKATAAEEKRQQLKLHFSRTMCRIVAGWLNSLEMTAVMSAEIMHPKRGMWVRFIRALRLTEFAKRSGYENLKTLLDVFYRKDYRVWQGEVNALKKEGDFDGALEMLRQRPGSFARQLFSTLLQCGDSEKVLQEFAEIAHKLPPRLLLTLGMYAEHYFDDSKDRTVKGITGKGARIDNPALLANLSYVQKKEIIGKIQDIYMDEMQRRFQAMPTDAKTIYIDPQLYDIPVSVGERSTTIQDANCALQGTRFKVEGNSVRLFMQWGKGLPAQHLDMDLSARIIYGSGNVRDCAYYQLSFEGVRHSGDIQRIPDLIGTAEYVDLNLTKLYATGAKYAVFTCNAYTKGNLAPNLVVGWMDSKFPMMVSEKTGVAYDPSCVNHQVRISEGNLSKGLVFGVLDIEEHVITWLEMPFGGQITHQLNLQQLMGFLQKLEARHSLGEILAIKQSAQNLELVDDPSLADEIYDYQWALDAAKVSGLLLE